jgi:hypothetical protein
VIVVHIVCRIVVRLMEWPLGYKLVKMFSIGENPNLEATNTTNVVTFLKVHSMKLLCDHFCLLIPCVNAGVGERAQSSRQGGGYTGDAGARTRDGTSGQETR